MFSQYEEQTFVECIVTMAKYGFSIDTLELRYVIKKFIYITVERK